MLLRVCSKAVPSKEGKNMDILCLKVECLWGFDIQIYLYNLLESCAFTIPQNKKFWNILIKNDSLKRMSKFLHFVSKILTMSENYFATPFLEVVKVKVASI